MNSQSVVRPIYRPGDVVTEREVKMVTRRPKADQEPTEYVVLSSPCCGKATWMPLWSFDFNERNGRPSAFRCGRAWDLSGHHGTRGCDWRWSVALTRGEDNRPVAVTWTCQPTEPRPPVRRRRSA